MPGKKPTAPDTQDYESEEEYWNVMAKYAHEMIDYEAARARCQCGCQWTKHDNNGFCHECLMDCGL